MGNNCSLIIKEKANNNGSVSFNLEGNGSSICIGKDCAFMFGRTSISAQEGKKIEIGDNCLFSFNVYVKTSDSHPILDAQSGKRLNEAKDVFIGNKVWVCQESCILKGSYIADNSVVGLKSVVTKEFHENGVLAGNPARLVKKNILWERNL